MMMSNRRFGSVMFLVAGLFLCGAHQQGFAQTGGETKGKAGAPINITAFGGKLVVTSDDPEALKLVSELVRILTSTKAGPGDFEVIRLHYANAVDVAKILDEAFNAPKAVVAGIGNGKGGGGGRGAQNQLAALAATAQHENRIRVVADPATNALLVQASPLDMLTIRNLLAKQLDAGNSDSDQLVKTFVIGPLKSAYAIDVAAVLRDVYRESMDNNSRRLGQISNPFTGASRTPALNIDANGSPKGVSLSLGIDDKTNSLIVACPTSLYTDIKKLVDQMDLAAADTKQSVKFVRIPGVDPALIQQALLAIQGRSAPTGGLGGPGGQGGAAGTRGGNFGGGGRGAGGAFAGGGGFTSPTFMPSGGGRRPAGGGGASRLQ
jgi:hypothetical protein